MFTNNVENPSFRRRPALVAAALLLPLVAAACGGDEGSASPAPTGETTPAAEFDGSVPDGTTLRVADQSDSLTTVLAASGQDGDIGYKVEYADFQGGPAMLQAFEAGEVDVGWVADTPLIFAQAGGQDIVGVAAWSTEQSGLSLVTAPGVEIGSWADTEGKQIAFQRGTVLQAAVLQGLDAGGLAFGDIEAVDLPFPQIQPALEGGQVDGAILAEPLTSAYLAANPDASLVERASDLTDRTSFIIASKDALDDPGKAAAIADYIERLVGAYAWADDNPVPFAEAFYGERYGLDGEQAAEYREIVGDTTFFELPGPLLEPQQRLADLYLEAGEIPEQLDVSAQFDGRFNNVVSSAKNAAG